MKKLFAGILTLALVLNLSACSKPDGSSSDIGASSPGIGESSSGDLIQTDADMFTDRDLAGTYQNAVEVTLSGAGYTITQEGIYLLSGALENGSITVDVSDKNAKVQLVLNGVDIFCQDQAPITVNQADKVFVTLADGSKNRLEAGQTDGVSAIFCRSDLTINGTGSLELVSPNGRGIECKDDLVITGGSIAVTCADHGLDANDSVRICRADLTIQAGKDGIHSENNEDASLGFVYISGGSLNITAQGDGISAGGTMQLQNADISVLAGGGWQNSTKDHSDQWGQMGPGMGHRPRETVVETEESTSMKGLKSGLGMLICSGTFTLDTADDAIHSNESITIQAGQFTLYSGDDGVHAEDTLTIGECAMEISQSYEGLEATNILIRGGTFHIQADDDGLNAAGGVDESGTTGGRDGQFGPGMGGAMGSGGYGNIEISGGSLTIYSGGDGLDSNGDLTISGGYIYVTNPTSGDVSVLDSQNQPVITGGTYIGLASGTMMAETFSTKSSTQGFLAGTCNLPAQTVITVQNAAGKEILSVTTEYSTRLIIFSSADIQKGDAYTITINDQPYDLTAQ